MQELFENFYYIWAKLKNGDAECKDVEWKRRMHFVLDQLKSGKTLTTRYPINILSSHGSELTTADCIQAALNTFGQGVPNFDKTFFGGSVHEIIDI